MKKDNRKLFMLSVIMAWMTLTGSNASACKCDGVFVLKSSIPERRVPSQAFEAHHRKGNLQTHNQCRRDARDDAHACMNAIWRARNSPGSLPPECVGNLSTGQPRFVGELPRNIKRDIEIAVCRQPSDLGDQNDTVIEVFTRTGGDRGCGPNLQKSVSKKLTDYRVDCLAVRDRENRAGNFIGRIARTFRDIGYDRPGSDFLHISTMTFWRDCRDECERRRENPDPNRRCRSWTAVPEGHEFQGCWLKNTIPWSVRNELPGGQDEQMRSGTISNPR
jgi:hypothetical protein